MKNSSDWPAITVDVFLFCFVLLEGYFQGLDFGLSNETILSCFSGC